MVLIPGETLATRAKERWHGKQWLSMAYQLVDAVHFLHVHHVVHRDLKSANVQWDASTGRLTLLDLGSACCVDCQDSCVGQYTGTPGFMAPDILALKRRPGDLTPWFNAQVDLKAADMFSLGVTLLATLLPSALLLQSVDDDVINMWPTVIGFAMEDLEVDDIEGQQLADLQNLLTGLTLLNQNARLHVADVRETLKNMMDTLKIPLPAFDTRAPANPLTAARYRSWGQEEPNCFAHIPCLQKEGTVLSRSYGMPLDERLSVAERSAALVQLKVALQWLHKKKSAHHALGLEYIFWDGTNLQLVPGDVPHKTCDDACFSNDNTELQKLINTYFTQSPQ